MRSVTTEPRLRAVRKALVCAECKREADERAVGWRGYLLDGDDDEDEDEDELVFFCSSCAEREFSPD